MEQSQQMAGGKSIVRRSEEEILKYLNEQEQKWPHGKGVLRYVRHRGANILWLGNTAEDVKDLGSSPGGFASIVPTLVHDRPQLFTEIGNIRLYKEVSAEYLKILAL